MVKLFLVEDEIVMREGIRKHIAWEKEGIEFAGEAGDGELALPMILSTKPDILLTDIRMPFMDGLQLSELVKKELPETEIIILSGYDDFSYAQKAITCGVSEYLLKPIAPPKLLASLRRVRDRIEKRKKEQEAEKSLQERLNSAFTRMSSEQQSRATEAAAEDVRADAVTDNTKNVDIDLKTLVPHATLHSSITDFLSTGTEDEVETYLTKLIERVGEKNIRSTIFRNYLTVEICLSIARFIHDQGLPEEEIRECCGDVNAQLLQTSSAEESRAILSTYMKEVIRQRNLNTDKGSESAIQKVVAEYLNQHITDPDVSLESTAAEASMSVSHFSRVFSKVMGQTYTDYVIGRRIGMAKEYLMNSDLRSSEIGFKVGYKDPHYFSATFKKETGMTPTEYRNRGNGNG
ncbi:MAG: response regulator [Oribacterium sp.]|nr:response regulator [Oribacterium sp.]